MAVSPYQLVATRLVGAPTMGNELVESHSLDAVCGAKSDLQPDMTSKTPPVGCRANSTNVDPLISFIRPDTYVE